jgi:hypothetical protein
MTREEQNIVDDCNNYLDQIWCEVTKEFLESNPQDPFSSDNPIRNLIVECLTSPTKTYHYILPTQLLAKCVNPSLDSHSLQALYSSPGAFDARTIAHEVIVPFDKSNHNVLGGSSEPYVNKPVRFPAVIPDYRDHQKRKQDWDKLIRILDKIEKKNDPRFTKSVFKQVLYEIYRLLSNVTVTYPTPNRISLERSSAALREFLSVTSGGERMETVCTALFQTIANSFGIFDEIRRQKINAPDTASGMAADIECWLNNEIILLVEVKDRSLTLTHLDDRLYEARSKRIREILFIAESGMSRHDDSKIQDRIHSEFSSGQNIYVTNFNDFTLGILILLGEKGRADFLSAVGIELDRVGANIVHRRAWAEILRSI